jgi:hypothetical protein
MRVTGSDLGELPRRGPPRVTCTGHHPICPDTAELETDGYLGERARHSTRGFKASPARDRVVSVDRADTRADRKIEEWSGVIRLRGYEIARVDRMITPRYVATIVSPPACNT